MSTNTQGHLRYDYETGYCGELIASNGTTVCTFSDEPSEANARRLVAAWNLLTAFTTEQIEAGAADLLTLNAEREELKAQRDELLAALKELSEIVQSAIDNKSASDLDSFTLQPASAAIARAEVKP